MDQIRKSSLLFIIPHTLPSSVPDLGNSVSSFFPSPSGFRPWYARTSSLLQFSMLSGLILHSFSYFLFRTLFSVISPASVSLRTSFNINIHQNYIKQDSFINIIENVVTAKDNFLSIINLQPQDLFLHSHSFSRNIHLEPELPFSDCGTTGQRLKANGHLCGRSDFSVWEQGDGLTCDSPQFLMFVFLFWNLVT